MGPINRGPVLGGDELRMIRSRFGFAGMWVHDRRMKMRFAHWLTAVALVAAPGVAADRPATADVRRLSPVEVEAILDAAAAKREAGAAPEARRIEGEIGVAIGTGGYREAFGTAVVPLGQDGTAIVSFDTVDSNRGRVRRHR